GPLDHFRVDAAPMLVGAGTAVSITITAEDVYRNAIPGYNGALDLTQNAGATRLLWSDTGACVTDNGNGTGSLAAGCWAAGVVIVRLADREAERPVRTTV